MSKSFLSRKEKAMNRKAVDSSNLRSVGYESGTLEIAFHGGRVYQYYNVPEHIYHGLMRADSKGKYHHQHIKSCYGYKRIA